MPIVKREKICYRMDVNWILENQLLLFAGIVLAGYIGMGWLVSDTRRKVKKILGPSDRGQMNLMHDILRRIARAEAQLKEMEPRLKITEEIAAMSIHKVGFIRFNPFQDMGGDNSFIAALLDRDNNGILLSSLVMREGARLYAKEIRNGAARSPLSDEEKKVLEEIKQKS